MFKDYVKAEAFDTKVLLEELLKYSKHYKAINDADSGNHRLDAVLRRLILLDMSVMNRSRLIYSNTGAVEESATSR